MDIQSALKSQYHASLKTLRLAIEQCPDPLWDDPADGFAAFWRVAYHALFFTHFYLQKDQHSFAPWTRHRDEAQFIGKLPWENNRAPKSSEPYTRDDIIEYWSVCDGMIDATVDALDLSAPECGFPWYPMPKLEHQLVNIRHIQHHAAALATRLRRQAGVNVAWVGRA
jgi:DinB superfamily